MTQVPTPRFDLLKMQHYLFGSVQFSRGCPFQCEFCDIIVTFGRRPRLKTSAQVIAELEALRAQELRIVFIVDDNLIGNKKAIKEVLRDVVAWQDANGYPLTFFTEASIDLADDAELMQLMVEANIIAVFIGIESPNEASLRETKKFQNVRAGRDDAREGPPHPGRGHGGLVRHDRRLRQRRRHASSTPSASSSREARIVHAMIGMLTAIPKTPLHARLADEGRLDLADEPEFGTNVIPLGMTPRGAARRLRRRDGRAVQPRGLLRPPRGPLSRTPIRFRPGRNPLLASTLPGRDARRSRSMRCERWACFLRLMRSVPDADLRRDLPPPHDDDAAPTAGIRTCCSST